jgi:hypothetical protein
MITDISISQIDGVLLGVSYGSEEIEIKHTEHNLQIFFFIFCLSFIWIREN